MFRIFKIFVNLHGTGTAISTGIWTGTGTGTGTWTGTATGTMWNIKKLINFIK